MLCFMHSLMLYFMQCEIYLNKVVLKFLDKTPKVQSKGGKKIVNWTLSKLTLFVLLKTPLRKKKDKSQTGRKCYKSHYWQKGFIQNI